LTFKSKELDKQISKLADINKELELKVTQLQSIENLKRVSQRLNLVKISQKDFVSPIPSTVAQR